MVRSKLRRDNFRRYIQEKERERERNRYTIEMVDFEEKGSKREMEREDKNNKSK